jgi:hypothetical protein
VVRRPLCEVTFPLAIFARYAESSKTVCFATAIGHRLPRSVVDVQNFERR